MKHGDVERNDRVGPREPLTVRFWSKAEVSDSADGCWEWTASRSRDGYGEFALGAIDRGRYIGAHRMAWMLAVGDIPDDLHVLHHCDNPPCVNPDHLWLGTNADNVADREAKGRNKPPEVMRGEDHPQAKLTWEQVQRIRSMAGMRHSDIARVFGVSRSAIGAILKEHRWTPSS